MTRTQIRNEMKRYAEEIENRIECRNQSYLHLAIRKATDGLVIAYEYPAFRANIESVKATDQDFRSAVRAGNRDEAELHLRALINELNNF